jgi:hypothetical protein
VALGTGLAETCAPTASTPAGENATWSMSYPRKGTLSALIQQRKPNERERNDEFAMPANNKLGRRSAGFGGVGAESVDEQVEHAGRLIGVC